jgi:hypothetical protein
VTDILEFGLLEVSEHPDGLNFDLEDSDGVFLDRVKVRQLLKFLCEVVAEWDREWN